MRVGLIVVAVAAALLPTSAAAQPVTIPDLSSKLKSGDVVYVLDHTLRETTGVFGAMSGSRLTVMVDGGLREIDLAEVRQVTRRGGDSLWNGILIGSAVGGLAGGASQGVGVGIGGAVIYGAIGALIDKVVQGRVVVYRAPTSKTAAVVPFASQGQRGVRVSISF